MYVELLLFLLQRIILKFVSLMFLGEFPKSNFLIMLNAIMSLCTIYTIIYSILFLFLELLFSMKLINCASLSNKMVSIIMINQHIILLDYHDYYLPMMYMHDNRIE